MVDVTETGVVVGVAIPTGVARDAVCRCLTQTGMRPLQVQRTPDAKSASSTTAADAAVWVVDVAYAVDAARDWVWSGAPVLVWGGTLTHRDIGHIADRGAAGYLPVSATAAQLCGTVRAVAAGGRLMSIAHQPSSVRLTPAEDRVLRVYLAPDGPTSRRECAAALSLSEATVKAHLANVRARLRMPSQNREQLASALREIGWH